MSLQNFVFFTFRTEKTPKSFKKQIFFLLIWKKNFQVIWFVLIVFYSSFFTQNSGLGLQKENQGDIYSNEIWICFETLQLEWIRFTNLKHIQIRLANKRIFNVTNLVAFARETTAVVVFIRQARTAETSSELSRLRFEQSVGHLGVLGLASIVKLIHLLVHLLRRRRLERVSWSRRRGRGLICRTGGLGFGLRIGLLLAAFEITI
jgi:hypothetical protein